MVKLYAEAGYHTIFVSDHLIQRFFDRLGDIPWAEKTEKFLLGYELAKEAGKEYGINVLLAAELSLNDSIKNHYLLYGIDKAFLDRREDLFDMSISEFHEYAKEHGVTVIQAHPYRDGETTPVDAADMDAMEVHNSGPRHENYTEKAIAFAKENGLPVTAGSDAHRYEDVGGSGILSVCEIKTVEDYVRVVMNREVELIM